MAKLGISDIPDFEYEGKRVFVRVDFNVPIKDGTISEDYRIRRAIPTIDYLIERGARVVVASHLGRPPGKPVPELSLKPVSFRLSELLGKPVKFAGDSVGDEVRQVIGELEEGEIALLENLRFHGEETKNDPEFAEELASLGDIYVNDAFGTSHRKHASTYGMGFYFELRLAGFLVQRELKFLSKLRDDPERPFLVIVGGAKIKDKIGSLRNLLDKADKVLIGGGVAYTFLSAKGIGIGNSLIEEEFIDWAREALKKYESKIFLPVDHVVAESLEKKTCMVLGEDIPNGFSGFDIGPRTIARFTSEIKDKGAIFWNGPMGVFEVGEFSAGTTHIARAVALATWRGTTSVVGGGDTIAALRKADVLDSEIIHISTGGGASLEFLGGEELPGISILDDKI